MKLAAQFLYERPYRVAHVRNRGILKPKHAVHIIPAIWIRTVTPRVHRFADNDKCVRCKQLGEKRTEREPL
jgi:hypothetical protein